MFFLSGLCFAVNKQLADKERVAAALENSSLLEVVNQCLTIPTKAVWAALKLWTHPSPVQVWTAASDEDWCSKTKSKSACYSISWRKTQCECVHLKRIIKSDNHHAVKVYFHLWIMGSWVWKSLETLPVGSFSVTPVLYYSICIVTYAVNHFYHHIWIPAISIPTCI